MASANYYPGERQSFDPYAYNEEEVYDQYRRRGGHREAAAERERILRRRAGADRQQMYGFAGEELGRGEELRGQTAGSRSEYLDRLRGFDPAGYAGDVARGTYAGLSEDLGRANTAREAGLNRRGLYGSNLGGGEQSRQFNRYLGGALARGGFQAAGLEAQSIGRFGTLHESDRGEAFETTGRGYDLYAGAADRNQAELNARKAEETARRNRPKWWETALGFGAEAAGAYFGAKG